MRRMALLPSVGLSLVSIGTAGCASFTSVRAYGECTTGGAGGNDCRVGAEMRWESGDPPGGGKKSALMSLMSAALSDVADASQFQIDTSGSTIPYPASGTLTLMLVRSADGVVIAAQSFAYVKSGTIIRLADPDAVNSWAYANAGDADTLKYETQPFTSRFQGPKTMAVSNSYEGQAVAAFTSTVYGNPACTTYPSPYQCQQQ